MQSPTSIHYRYVIPWNHNKTSNRYEIHNKKTTTCIFKIFIYCIDENIASWNSKYLPHLNHMESTFANKQNIIWTYKITAPLQQATHIQMHQSSHIHVHDSTRLWNLYLYIHACASMRVLAVRRRGKLNLQGYYMYPGI